MTRLHAEPISLPVPELKLLLNLTTFADYKAPTSALQVNAKTSPAERDRLCGSLQKKGFIDCDTAVTRFGLTAAGRTLLTLDTSVLPITPDERAVLKSCASGSIGPDQIYGRVPRDRRQPLVVALAQRGLLKITQQRLQTVGLTSAGRQFLVETFVPQGNTPVLSLTQMSQYLQFMRREQGKWSLPPDSDSDLNVASPPAVVTPEDLLQVIIHLDAALRTDNYLPIYYLREKLQPPLTRRGLDQQLYQLQRSNHIDISTLQDVRQYRRAEIAAGIPQDIGGPLFFISVL